MRDDRPVCCICGKPYSGYGCNPDGAAWLKNGEIVLGAFAAGAKCCPRCDTNYVTPGRILRYYGRYYTSNGKAYLNELK